MELVNTIDNKELYANRAVNDKNGKPIDTTYMDSSKLTIEGGKITEYNGTPFAGGGSGGKTYEGVAPIIVDNDNDTISADTIELETKEVTYQQITHDDSLVHVSNEAQYAIGINLPWLVTYLQEQGFVKN